MDIVDLIARNAMAKKTTKKTDKKEVQVKECMEQVHLVIQMGSAPPMTVRFSDEAHAHAVYNAINKLWCGRIQKQRLFRFTNDYGMYTVDVSALVYLAIADLSAIHSMRPFQLPA